MSNTSSARRFPWSSLAIAGLTILLLWWFIRDLDPEALQHAVTHANPWLLLLAVATTIQTYVLRAARWQILLAPLGAVPFGPAFRTTVIGFTATFLIPGRVGEVLRPYLLAKEQHLSASAAFATVIVERVLDLLAVLILFAVALPFLPIDVGPNVELTGLLAGVAALVGFGILTACAGHPERLGALVDRLTGWLPGRLPLAIGNFARKFAEGLSVLRDVGALARTLAWSLALWVSICLGIWLVTRAFGLEMPFLGSFLVVMYLVVGVSVPTPGGAGGFHVMYKWAVTEHFHASPEAAVAAGTILHLVSFVPVAILGFWFLHRAGLTLGSLKTMNTEGTGKP